MYLPGREKYFHDSPSPGYISNEDLSMQFGNSPISPPPLTTSLSLDNDCTERATPRAQTRYEFEEFERRTRSSSLQGTIAN